MSLKSKIEAVIYASEEPVTLQQLVGLLAEEAQRELDEIAAGQASLPLNGHEETYDDNSPNRSLLEAGTHEGPESGASDMTPSAARLAVNEGEIASQSADAMSNSSPPQGTALPAATQDEQSTDSAEATVSVIPPDPEDSLETPPGEQHPSQQQTPEDEKRRSRDRERAVRDHVRRAVDQLLREYAESDRGIEIREVASGFRMGTKPEYHDAVRGFVKSLKPALKLTLPALETLAVVAYKQPVTAAEISEIRGVDSSGVLGGLMARKLIATAGRKQVIGRPMLYKTTRDFLLRFGLKDVGELPSMEEFERMAGELAEQEDLPMDSPDTVIEQANARGDAEMIREGSASQQSSESDHSSAEAGQQTEGTISPASGAEQPQHNATAESAAGGNDETASQRVSQPAGQRDDNKTEEVSKAH